MSRWRAVRLTAGRELRERLRSRANLASTGALILLVAGIVIVVGLTGDDDGSSFELGTVGADAAAVADTAAGQADAVDAELELHAFDSEAEAVAAVEDDEVDLALFGDQRAIGGSNPPEELVALLQAASRQVRGAEQLRAEDVSEAVIGAALDPPPVEVTSVEEGGGGEGLALLSGILLYIAIIMAGLAVAQGVVEEKGSRVIELLLAAIRPVELLAGKVLGVGLIGLMQVIAVAGTGIGLALATGLVDLPASTAQTAVLAAAFFILGYLLYACAFAVAGALVSRQEDLTGSTSLLTMVLVGGYLASITAIEEPSSPFAVATTLLPLSAPMVVPVRAARDALPAAELVAAIVLTLGAVLLLLWGAARIYERTVLRMGAPLKLKQALRLAR